MRAATRADLDAVASLTAAVDQAQGAEPTYRRDEILVDWDRPGFDLGTDSWFVDAGGEAVAFGQLCPRGNSDLVFMMWIHPDRHEVQLADELIPLMDRRARALASGSGYQRGVAITYEREELLRRAVQDHGFEPDALFVEMVMSLQDGLAPVPGIEGIALRTFEPDTEARPFYDVLVDAFSEHWGGGFPPFEEWWRDVSSLGTYDPYFSVVAEEGSRMVGALFSTLHDGLGEVHDVGVLRELRGRGVGRALMLESFRRFRERGGTRVRLWVDTANVTEAIRLYQSIGMTVARKMHFYAKDLS